MKCKLSEVMDLIGGGTPKTSKPEYWNGNIPWISVKDFNNDFRYVYKTEKSITQLGLQKSSTKLLQRGDVIISARGTVGEIATIPFAMAFNQSCYGLRAKKGMVTSDYLYYLIKHNVSVLKKNTHGSVFDTITRNTFDNIEVEIPSIKIQQKISSILNDYDKKIELNNAINNNLLQQSLYIFDTLINSASKDGCIGDYCTLKSGFAFKSKWWQDSGIPVIKIGSINQDYLNLSNCSHVSEDKISLAKDFIVSGGDLLIAMTGATIGKFTMVPKMHKTILVNQRVGKFFLGENPINKIPFIYCTLKQPEIISEIINRGQGSAQPNISASDIMSIPCVIPQTDEINNFNLQTAPMFELIINNQVENLILAKTRDLLLLRLMSGEIDISNISF